MSDELDDILGTEADDEGLDETVRLLSGSRPVPPPGFRGELGRLVGAAWIVRPVRHLRLKALGLAAGGALLLGLAGAGVAGGGPLAPSKATQGPSNAAGTTTIPSGRR